MHIERGGVYLVAYLLTFKKFESDQSINRDVSVLDLQVMYFMPLIIIRIFIHRLAPYGHG